MTLQAGFAEVDISPRTFPVRTYWAPVQTVIDPLYAHAAVFDDGISFLAFLSLDIVIIERDYVRRIRERVSQACPILPAQLMVCATHNHACPAVVERPWSAKDEAYLDALVAWSAEAVITAWQRRVPVEIGSGTGHESRVSFNRRFILKNGTVISQPAREIMDQQVLFGESIIDPELGVVCVRDLNHQVIGLLVNFACHAVHLMGSLSAGFPGVLGDRLKASHGAQLVTVFLNGACGNLIHRNYADPDQQDTKDKIGTILADDVTRIMRQLSYAGEARLASATSTIKVRYREIDGLAQNLDNLAPYNVFRGLIERGWYTWSLAKLRELHAASEHEDAELQVLMLGHLAFGAVPAEYFCQLGLRIKEESVARETFIVSLANGWLGYIPHRAAFDRLGGHETTWCYSCKMAPEVGDQLADALLALMRDLVAPPSKPIAQGTVT